MKQQGLLKLAKTAKICYSNNTVFLLYTLERVVMTEPTHPLSEKEYRPLDTRDAIRSFIRESLRRDEDRYLAEDFPEMAMAEVERFRSYERDDPGTEEAHAVFAEFLIPQGYIEAIVAAHDIALATKDEGLDLRARRALYIFQCAFDKIQSRANEHHVSTVAALADMQRCSMDGDPAIQEVYAIFRQARDNAMNLIIELQSSLAAVERVETLDEDGVGADELKPLLDEFAKHADTSTQKYEQIVNGLDFGPGFVEDIKNPKTKAIVLSLDFNSTWNRGESYPSQPLVGRAVHELEALSHAVRTQLPDTKLYVVINTGRPSMYIWGALEALKPMKEMRVFALAESGGAILEQIHDGRFEAAVPDSENWQIALEDLRAGLAKQIRGRMHVEPKQSMLSIQIAKKVEGDLPPEYLLRTKDGSSVDEKWFEREVEAFIDKRIAELRRTIAKKADQLEHAEDIREILQKAPVIDTSGVWNAENVSDLLTEGASLQAVLAKYLDDDLRVANQEYQTMLLLKKSLVVDFNPTAGFVDIHHEDLNKYSTLREQLAKRDIHHSEAVILHIGDSTTDIMPEKDTAEDQPNAGADRVYLVGVANSNKKMQEAVARRGTRGKMAARDSVLALIDMIKGMRKAIGKATETGSGGSVAPVAFDAE